MTSLASTTHNDCVTNLPAASNFRRHETFAVQNHVRLHVGAKLLKQVILWKMRSILLPLSVDGMYNMMNRYLAS
jgi:hypothetical protein